MTWVDLFVLSFSLSWGLCESFDASILNKFLSRYCNHYQYNMYISLKGKRFRLQVFFGSCVIFFAKRWQAKRLLQSLTRFGSKGSFDSFVSFQVFCWCHWDFGGDMSIGQSSPARQGKPLPMSWVFLSEKPTLRMLLGVRWVKMGWFTVAGGGNSRSPWWENIVGSYTNTFSSGRKVSWIGRKISWLCFRLWFLFGWDWYCGKKDILGESWWKYSAKMKYSQRPQSQLVSYSENSPFWEKMGGSVWAIFETFFTAWIF